MRKNIKIILIILITSIFLGACASLEDIKEMMLIQSMNKKEITEFQVVGDEVHMNGLINSKTYDQFVKILEENPQIKTIVELNMGGSLDDDTMIKLAYFVREKGLNTKLLSYSDINSGAVDLFLAGVERTMEAGAHIGVHSWSDGVREAKDFPRDAKEHEQNRKYIEVMLGEDDFYWFTIYAAPADGIYGMTEEEIETYKILTNPIIRENLTGVEGISAVMNNNFGKIAIGNINSDTIIINAQGGPMIKFLIEETYDIFVNGAEVDLEKAAIINIHQEQTIHPWLVNEKEISFEDAKKYDKKSVERLVDTIKYFKNKGKTVFVVGISFGAFVVQDALAEYGNIADKYLIMVGRLNMPEGVWKEFSNGKYVGFEYDEEGNAKIVNFDSKQAGMGGSGSIEDMNMAKLAAGLGYKRYIDLLQDTDLSNVIYAYGKTDEQVGSLSDEELEFLKLKDVKIISGHGGHGETISGFIKEGVELLFDIQ